MNIEYTFSMIKPDGVKRNLTGVVNSYFEKANLEIAAQKLAHITRQQAEQFYSEHANKSFFNDFVEYMTSGPVILQVLKGEDAIKKNRQIMGATNPKDAEVGTIRKDFAISIDKNTVHGSDSPESAVREIAFFFSKAEILR